MFLKTRRIHFVGIGGIGMSGIAEVLRNLDYEVRGSDARRSATTDHLESLGCTIFLGHDARHVQGAHVVVRSSAVKPDNVEVVAAQALGIPVIPRAEMLAELMRMKMGVAVAGSHGKTTTTSLLASVFAEAGLDPTVVVGGKLNSVGTNAVLGRGDWMVAEADESDGSFLHLSPVLGIVTNIDAEHMDHYGTLAALIDAFVTFANGVPFYGACILCLDHPAIQGMLPRIGKRTVTYGVSALAEIRATDLSLGEGVSQFQAWRGEHALGPVTLRIPGRHNVLNALATLAAGLEADIPFAVIQRGLARFEGVQRRFTVRGTVDGVLVVDDYAHHPEEIRATLLAARENYGRRVVAIWQPHRYSRVSDLLAGFMGCFNDASLVAVMEIYAAGESAMAGLDGASLADGLRKHGHKGATHTAGRPEVLSFVCQRVRKGDMVITLGAGDVTQLSLEIVDVLATQGPRTLEID